MAHLILSLRGTGIISTPVPKKLLLNTSIDDCSTSSRGFTTTLGNFAKAIFSAIFQDLQQLNPTPTPNLCTEAVFTKSPYREFIDHLVKIHHRDSLKRTQSPTVATTYRSIYNKNKVN
jgi:small subunit ribosomal protein S2e